MVHSWHFPSQPSKRVRRRQEVIEPYHDGTKPEPKKNIPFPPTHISRTSSELQLVEDTQAAEWRDLCMFQRLVGGIRQREHAHRYLFDQQVRQVRSRFRNGSDQTTAAPPPPSGCSQPTDREMPREHLLDSATKSRRAIHSRSSVRRSPKWKRRTARKIIWGWLVHRGWLLSKVNERTPWLPHPWAAKRDRSYRTRFRRRKRTRNRRCFLLWLITNHLPKVITWLYWRGLKKIIYKI